MSRSRSTKGVALLMLLAPALGSCVADGVSLRITCNVVAEGDCTYTTAGLCMLKGWLNLNPEATSTYSTVLRVTNGLKSRDTEVPVQAEPNGVQISEIEVQIRDSAGRRPDFGSLPNPYTVRASGYIEPGGDGLVGADLLPKAYVKAIRTLESTVGLGTISLSVIARGKTSGDVEVESQEWPWFINLINLSVVPSEGDCVISEEPVCRLGQDTFAGNCDPAQVPVE